MSDRTAIEAQLNRDRQEMEELRKQEAAVLQSITLKGFHAATDRVNLISKMNVLADEIHKNEERLAEARD